MSNKTSYEDVIMTDSYDNSFVGLFSSFNYKPCKRTYLEMMNESGQTSINNRIDKFKIMNKNEKILENKISESISNKNNTEQIKFESNLAVENYDRVNSGIIFGFIFCYRVGFW